MSKWLPIAPSITVVILATGLWSCDSPRPGSPAVDRSDAAVMSDTRLDAASPGSDAPAGSPGMDADVSLVDAATTGTDQGSGTTPPVDPGCACPNGCHPVTGACYACKPNTRSCSDSAAVACKADGSGTESMACTSGCNPDTGECRGCVPGNVWCNGNTLRTCSAAGVPMDRETCVHGCTPTANACRVCPAGERMCSGNMLRSCRADGSGYDEMFCANRCNATRLACNVCFPDARACVGGNAEYCPSDGSGPITTPCATGCNAATGECNDCQPGALSCNGNALRECTAAGQQRDRQTCSDGCNSARQACNACAPSSKRCSGNTLISCAADGGAATMMTCPLGCDAARAACISCLPQTEICDGMDNDCDGDRDENLTEPCSTACGQGMRRCLNGRWEASGCPREPAQDDAMACGAPGGGSCERCPGVSNGTGVCRSGVCNIACDSGFLRCGGVPGSCVKSNWSFESGSAEGFALGGGFQSDAADGFMVDSTRAADGTRAIRIPANFGNNDCMRRSVRVNLSLCPSGGGSDVAGKTLSFQVYLDGPALPPGEVEFSAGGGGAFTQTTPAANRWVTVQHRFGSGDTSIGNIFVQIYMNPHDPPPASICLAWRGTIYIDNVRIQ